MQIKMFRTNIISDHGGQHIMEVSARRRHVSHVNTRDQLTHTGANDNTSRRRGPKDNLVGLDLVWPGCPVATLQASGPVYFT